MACEYCIDDLDYAVTVAHITTKCLYHKTVGERYVRETVAPRGMCRELFHAAYPECLALLYGGEPAPWRPRRPGRRAAKVRCPAPVGTVAACAVSDILPRLLVAAKELAEEFCKVLYRPVDAHLRRVALRVEETAPSCSRHTIHDARYRFNTRSRTELCPAAFAAVYPYLRPLAARHKSMAAPLSMRIHCPDCRGVVFDLSLGGGNGGDPQTQACSFEEFCRAANTGDMTVKADGGPVSIRSFIPAGLCPLAFHSVYAYIHTLATGGWFNWVARGGRVIVNCPCPKGVAFFVGKTVSDDASPTVRVEVMETSGECHCGYQIGQTFVFRARGEDLAKLALLDRGIPVLLGLLADHETAPRTAAWYDGDREANCTAGTPTETSAHG